LTAHASSFGLLLVDDEKSLLLSLKRALADEPYRLHTASSGEEALAILTSNTINAAVVDLKMPGMSGIDLNKKIKKEYPHVSVVILTAHGGVREAVAALQSGAVDFLEKPFSPTGIRARLRQLYKIWQLKNENRELNDQLKFQFGFRPLVGNSPAMMDLKRLPPERIPALFAPGSFRSQRNLGAVALEWCWLAAGRCQLYLHGGQKLWDYAAGRLIATEAGATSALFDPRGTQPDDQLTLDKRTAIAAATPALLNDWLNLIQLPLRD